ncbi:MAG: stage II sporulation protein P [Bacillota bacterium]
MTRVLLTAAVALISVSVCILPAARVGAEELRDGYFTVITDLGQEILCTGRVLESGDRYINWDNRMYEVYRVSERSAYARYVGRVDLSGAVDEARLLTAAAGEWGAPLQEMAEENTIDVGVYHTHDSECYVPTSGTDSNEEGGDVVRVGEAMKEQLEREGVSVTHLAESHAPHDAAAYTRSRRTAVELLQEQADVLFDIHRDAAPADRYLVDIDGQEVSRVLFVVGRANPNMNGNLSFAKALKAAADEEYPGLVKGILMARGDYNQDLGPRVLLLEVGSHEVSLEHAEAAVVRLAGVVPAVLPGGGEEEEGSSSAAWWLIASLVLGGGIFLLISTGSWEEALARLNQYNPWSGGGRPR